MPIFIISDVVSIPHVLPRDISRATFYYLGLVLCLGPCVLVLSGVLGIKFWPLFES